MALSGEECESYRRLDYTNDFNNNIYFLDNNDLSLSLPFLFLCISFFVGVITKPELPIYFNTLLTFVVAPNFLLFYCILKL